MVRVCSFTEGDFKLSTLPKYSTNIPILLKEASDIPAFVKGSKCQRGPQHLSYSYVGNRHISVKKGDSHLLSLLFQRGLKFLIFPKHSSDVPF